MSGRSGRPSSFPVLLPTAGMELCRWYITAGLLFIIPDRGSVPLLQSAFALTGAMFLAMLLRRLKHRRIAELLAHTAGISVSLYLILKGYAGLPFSDSDGLVGFLDAYTRISSPGEWFSFSLILAWTLLLWLRGRHLGIRDADYPRTVARFDAGILLIFAVYFLRMGLRLVDPDALSSVSAYLLFGIISIYAARNRDRDRTFIHSSSATGLVLLFAAGFVIVGTAGVVLYPVLENTAGEVYSVIKKGTQPFQPLLIAFLRFLFGRRSAVSAGASNAGPASGDISSSPPQEPGFWLLLLEKILVYSMAAILGVLAILIAGYLLWRLASHLSSLGENQGEGLSFRDFLRILLGKIRAAAGKLLLAVRKVPSILPGRRRRKMGAGSAAFRRLLSWGRVSGIKIRSDETAGEYGRRLAGIFPSAADAVAAIVKHAENEAYGERPLSAQEHQELRRALSRTGRFRLLPVRLLHRLGWRD